MPDTTRPPSRRAPVAVLSVVIAAGVVLRFAGLRFGLPYDLARPDEERITGAALGILHGDLNPHFFLYPSVFIYLTAGGYALAYVAERALGSVDTIAHFISAATTDPTVVVLVPRVLAALTGAATIAALFAAGRELLSTRAALAAAAFLAVAFLHVRDSHFGVTDVPVTLLTVCAFWAAARCLTKGASVRRVSVTGVLCGLAASTKYTAALIALPALVAIADDAERTGRRWVAAIGSGVVLVACSAGGFLLGTPYALIDRPAFLEDLLAQRRILMGRGAPGSVLWPASQVYGAPGWIRHATFSLPYGLGLPLFVVALAGAGWLVIRRPRLAVFTLSFPIASYAVLGVSLLAYPRWVVPIVPFLCLTAGVLVDRAADAVARFCADARLSTASATVLALTITAPTAATSIAFDRLMARTDARVLGSQWIRQEYPAGATVYQTGMVYGHLQLRPAAQYPQYAFDERHGSFVHDEHPVTDLPGLIVELDSPLVVFSHVPQAVRSLLETRYALRAAFRGIGDPTGDAPVYDQQDAFYAPFAHVAGVTRPGPTVRIFERRDD